LSQSVSVIVITTGLLNQSIDNTFSMFPQPTNNYITISSLIEIKSYKIYDTEGSLLANKKENNNLEINVSYLNSGLYFKN